VKASIDSRKIPALSATFLSSIATTTQRSDSRPAKKSGMSHSAGTSRLVTGFLARTFFFDGIGGEGANSIVIGGTGVLQTGGGPLPDERYKAA
jgi:hypothetical protein